MKWFKHQSCARNDERISRLEDACGLEGYGFYFKTLEIIAESMDETNRDFIEYSVNVWAKKIGVLPSKFKKLAENCAQTGLISLAISVQTDKKLSIKRSEMYKITSPNLLKYRDNHTKNLQVTNKQEVEVEVEVEQIQKEKKKEHKAADKSASSPAAFILPDWIDKTQWDLWIKTRKGKKMIPEQMQKQVEKLKAWRDEGKDHCGALANSALNGWTGIFLPDSAKNGTRNQTVQEARLECARQIMGGSNGTDRQIIDITPERPGQGSGARIPEVIAGLRQSNAGEVGGD